MVGIHPHLATVTYLTTSGGGTVITDVISPRDSSGQINKTINNMYINKPQPLKHICFDGRLLHAG